jgi:phage tail-like protein
VELADRLERFVALLDVPPSLTSRQILRWRSQFRSSYAAAYHPWLLVNRSDQRRDKLIRLNPAAAAAGIIARQVRCDKQLNTRQVTDAGRLLVHVGVAPSEPTEFIASGQPLGDGGFQECSGLDIETDVQEYLEGGRNDGVIRRVGRAKYTNIVLKRGMFFGDAGTANRDLWNWIQAVAAGQRPVPRYDGIINCTTLIASASVVSPSYTPGAGNVW